jgi:hypothetical protein
MNGHRPQSPSDPENPGSPSKRPRLGEQQFNGQMGPNGRGQGVPGVGPQGGGMLMQTGVNQKAMGQGQFQGFGGQNQAMQQKLMQQVCRPSRCSSTLSMLISLQGRDAERHDRPQRHG